MQTDSPAEKPMAPPAQQPIAQQVRAEVVDLCNSPPHPSASPSGFHATAQTQPCSAQDIADAAAKDASPMVVDGDEQPIEHQGDNNAVAISAKVPSIEGLGKQQGSYAQAASNGQSLTQAGARTLTVSGPMTGSADPYWQGLSDMIVQGSVSSQEQAQELQAVFDKSNVHNWQGHVPAYVLSGWSSHYALFILY